jgi:hypothetical protein
MEFLITYIDQKSYKKFLTGKHSQQKRKDFFEKGLFLLVWNLIN